MGDQVVRTLFFGTFLFLLGEYADSISNDFGLRLASLTRQPSDQRLRLGIQPNTQRHKSDLPVIHNCTTDPVRDSTILPLNRQKWRLGDWLIWTYWHPFQWFDWLPAASCAGGSLRKSIQFAGETLPLR